jgi:hypothetical protein
MIMTRGQAGTLRVNILALTALTWPPCLRTAVAQAEGGEA